MTVCIAAICMKSDHEPIIIGAADRKITAGDIQFEPPTQKIYHFSDNIVALIAGDSAAQLEICSQAYQYKPQTVRETVRHYCNELGQYNLRQAEQIVLAPLGFTMKTFLSAQRRLSPEFVESVFYDMRRERERAEVETIICGIDGPPPGAQLYSISRNGRSSLQSAIGFTAIGDGAWHAESQFMFARYTPYWYLSRAMMLTYIAKKRAEVAPGVGLETDFFFIADRGFSNLHEPILGGLEECYRVLGEAQESAVRESNSHLDEFLVKLVETEFGESEQSSTPSSQTTLPEPPPDSPPPESPESS